MKHLFIQICLCLLFPCVIHAKQFTVIDANDRNPIPGATVIDKTGLLKGITDNKGNISIGDTDFPVSIRCVGYGQTLAEKTSDTIVLLPSVYELGEFVINTGERPITRVVCFAREYCSGIVGTDTLQLYCEYMAEAFISKGKVKGYKRSDARPTVKAARRYARIAKESGDSVFSPKPGDDIADISWFSFMAFLPEEDLEMPPAMKQGAESDTINGKYSPKFIFRKRNGLFTKTADILCDNKDRVWSPWFFKLLGLTTDINEGYWTLTYADKGTGVFGIRDFISGTYNLHLIGRGKWIKKAFNTQSPIEMDSFLELYPVSFTNHTVEEYKELKDDFSGIRFKRPSNIEPLSPSIQMLIDQIETK